MISWFLCFLSWFSSSCQKLLTPLWLCLNPLWGTSDSACLCLDPHLNKPAVFTIWASDHTQTLQEKKKKITVWISKAQWTLLTVLSVVCWYVDFVIYKQYGRRSRRECVFGLTLEVALKQSVSGFDLHFRKDCLPEFLRKTFLSERCAKWQILHSNISVLYPQKDLNLYCCCLNCTFLFLFLFFSTLSCYGSLSPYAPRFHVSLVN